MRNSCKTPILTGEDIYLKENFLPLFEKKAIAICQPDLATAGGLLETKKIGDLAMEHGIAMAMHMAGTPVALFAAVHCTAATENVLVLEHHGVDNPTYDDLAEGVPKPLLGKDGYVPVPDGPGLGIELNEKAIKESIRRRGLDPDKLFFPPTDQWNTERSLDRQWSRLWQPDNSYFGWCSGRCYMMETHSPPPAVIARSRLSINCRVTNHPNGFGGAIAAQRHRGHPRKHA